MQITPGALRALNTQFSGIYQRGYSAAVVFYTMFASVVTSSTKSNTYGWMAKIAKLREWIGERVVNNLASHSYTLENKPFEGTIAVDRDDFDDDNLGIYAPTVEQLGQQAAKYPDDLVVTLLQQGHAQLCFDGQNYFDTDHPVNVNDAAAGTQQNYWASGKSFTQANVLAVRAAMMAFKGEDGRPLGVMPTHVAIPPALEATAREIFDAEMIETAGGGAQSNITRGMLKYVVIPELGGEDGTWYMLDLSKPIKPFVFQNRKAPKFQQFTQDSDQNVFWHRQYIWGVDARGNAGYALWFLAAKAAA
jgi:phage major head subunit gpT-like protein